MKYVVCACLLVICALAQAEISVIALQRNDVEQVLTIVKSQLAQGSSAQLYQNQLILHAPAQEIQKIKQLLTLIDHQGRTLFISVTTDQAHNIESPTQTQVIHTKNTQTTLKTRRQNTQMQAQGLQTIRATEGIPSFIQFGQSRLLGETWQQANTGFYATAYIVGEQVNLQIQQQQQVFTQQQYRNTQQLVTHTTGLLNQWITIGTIVSQQNNAQTQQQILLKVNLSE